MSTAGMVPAPHNYSSLRSRFHDLLSRGTKDSFNFALGGIVVAIAIGALAAVGPTALIPLGVVGVVVLAVPIWGATMTDVLMASIFLEVISFGGLTLSRLLAPLALVILALALIRGRVRFHPGPLLIPMGAYVIWAIASVTWTVSMPHTVEILGSLLIALVYMASFAILVQDERDLRRTLGILTFASLIVGLLSTLSFAGINVVGGGDSLQSGRSQGGVGDPNFFANVQLVAMPIMLALAANARTWVGRAFFGGATLVAITSIFATLSRGGMIALVVVFLILPFLPASWMLGTRRQKMAVMLALALALGALFTRPTFREEVVSRIQTLFVSQSAQQADGSSSGSGRTELWKAAFASIKERPVRGLGIGAYPSQSNRLLFGTPGVNLELIANHPDGIEVHSAFIGTTVDLGFVGLTAFVGMILTTMGWLLRLAARARRIGQQLLGSLSIALVLSIVGWALSSIFIETETARPIWIVMGLTLAIGKILHRLERIAYAQQMARWQANLMPPTDEPPEARPLRPAHT